MSSGVHSEDDDPFATKDDLIITNEEIQSPTSPIKSKEAKITA